MQVANICMYVYVCIYVCVCMNVCMYVCMYECCVYVCMYVHMYMYTQGDSLLTIQSRRGWLKKKTKNKSKMHNTFFSYEIFFSRKLILKIWKLTTYLHSFSSLNCELLFYVVSHSSRQWRWIIKFFHKKKFYSAFSTFFLLMEDYHLFSTASLINIMDRSVYVYMHACMRVVWMYVRM